MRCIGLGLKPPGINARAGTQWVASFLPVLIYCNLNTFRKFIHMMNEYSGLTFIKEDIKNAYMEIITFDFEPIYFVT